MKRADAIPYISFAVDSALAPREISEMPANARLVGWQCGFEPLFVAVWSMFDGVKLDDDVAEEIAHDLLVERGWFGTDSKDSKPADYVL